MTKAGRYKVYVWGQPDNHVSNWNGENHRTHSVKGQPSRGFETRQEAEEWARKKFSDYDVFEKYAGWCGDGTFVSESRFKEADFTNTNLVCGL
tara:strand:- start:49 stop:327 length:279 start_codon:yes stop_codon:yes gene_type:complete